MTQKENQKPDFSVLYEARDASEKAQEQERINEKVNALNKELSDIFDRAFNAAVSERIHVFQERTNSGELTDDELQAIQDERKDFEADPSKYGIVREKCPIVDEDDKKRALQIVELLKDTKQLAKQEEKDFLSRIAGFGDRQLAKMTEEQRKQVHSR